MLDLGGFISRQSKQVLQLRLGERAAQDLALTPALLAMALLAPVLSEHCPQGHWTDDMPRWRSSEATLGPQR